MRSLKWSIAHTAFVNEIDDEHKEIFEAVSNLQTALSGGGSAEQPGKSVERLVTAITEHFAHEERLMRAASYPSIRWHKQQHDHAHKRVAEFVRRMQEGDGQAGFDLIVYLTSWLHDHTRLADRMLGAFLRIQRLCKVTLHAGTRPADACTWVDATGARFDPLKKV